MGREWLYWVGGGMGRRRITMKPDNNDQSTSAGCMCAVFQLFDLHHHLPLNHQHSLSPFLPQPPDTDTATCKGVEAPRNSLEMEEPPAAKQEQNLNFPGGIQIKTKREDFCTENSMDSPGTKTPNLVARLMGLDLLPESSSPSFSCPNSKTPSKSHLNQTKDRKGRSSFYEDDINVGARSLPATPRISSARRSDVDYHHHRLSLQINKDSYNEEFAVSVSAKTTRPRFRPQQQDENRSPGHYAKQILKQVKESVSRRVGHDITNTTTDRDETIRRDQNLLLKLSKKHSISHDTNQSTTPPKLRIFDTNINNSNKPPLAETKSPKNSLSSDATPSVSNPKHQPINAPQHQKTNKIGKKLSPKNCDQVIRNKKEDAFVRSPAANKVNLTDKNKSKKAPLSSELLHLSGPTILPVKKGPSPPATKLPQKQVQVSDADALSSKRNTQLSRNTSRSYKLQLLPDKIFTLLPDYVVPDTTNGCATAADYRCYIHKILKRAGIIDKLTPLTLGKWHTPSHPLDPSIFYYLELFHPAAAPSAAVLSRRCNRKLIFQLVDEILADVLRPHLDYKPWISPAVGNADHFGLVDDLCRKIDSFPAVDCQVLEDIDFLIEKDLSKAALNGYYEEEGERLVREIEGEIVERLVSETVAEGQNRWMSRGRGELSRDEMS